MLYFTPTIGASGAIYGLLLAYGLLFPDRMIYLFIFPVPARIYVIIAGALVLWSARQNPGGGTAHFAHLGGMIFGYFYLTWGRGGPMAEMKYRYTKWRIGADAQAVRRAHRRTRRRLERARALSAVTAPLDLVHLTDHGCKS